MFHFVSSFGVALSVLLIAASGAVNVNTIHGCSEVSNNGPSTINLFGNSATSLSVSFAGCSLTNADIVLSAPTADDARACAEVSIEFNNFTLEGGSIVIAALLVDDSTTLTGGELKQLENVTVLVTNNTRINTSGHALLVNATNITARSLNLSATDSQITASNTDSCALSISSREVSSSTISVEGNSKVRAGGRLAASIEATNVSST